MSDNSKNRIANAGVRHLDMEQGADRRGDIDDARGLRRGTVFHVPAEEHERNVRVVGVPFAVGGADVVVFELEREHLGAWQGVNIA